MDCNSSSESVGSHASSDSSWTSASGSSLSSESGRSMSPESGIRVSSATEIMPFYRIPNADIHAFSLEDSSNSIVFNGTTPDSASKEILDRELTPVLAHIMALSPYNNHHPQVQCLYKWLTRPETSGEDFKYVVGKLQENVCYIMTNLFQDYIYNYGDDGSMVYVLKIAAEALSVRCPVLEGIWFDVAWGIFLILNDRKNTQYGPASAKLSTWIIRVVGDLNLCPNKDLQLEMLLMYRAFIKINDDNREQALESLMSACSFLERRGDSFFPGSVSTTDIIDMLMLFSEDNSDDDAEEDEENVDDSYLYQYGCKVAERLKHYRNSKMDITNDNSLNTNSQPREVQSLTALLKYIRDGGIMAESMFRSKVSILEEAARGLNSIVEFFNVAFQDPVLVDVTAECVLDLLEEVVICASHTEDVTVYDDALDDINSFMIECCDDTYADYVAGPVEMVIIKTYKERICSMRTLISKKALEDTVIYNIIYNDQY